MISESHFPSDIRVKREAYTLLAYGHEVSIIALKDIGQKFYEKINGIKVYRVPKIELFKRGKHLQYSSKSLFNKISTLLKAVLGYGVEYSYFTVSSFIISLLVTIRENIDVIHTHNPPDTLFVVAGFYKLFGKKFVYDHHDLSPDLFLEKYKGKRSIIYKVLFMFEKISCKLADRVIASNESYKKIEIERCGIRPENIYVVRYGPDLNEMRVSDPIQEIRLTNKTVLCYLGTINIQDGLDILLIMLSKLIYKYKLKDVMLLIIGDGDYLRNIKALSEELNLSEYIHFTGFINDRTLLNRYLSSADIFVDAAPFSFLNDNSTFIKIVEYMIFKKPIVTFALKETRFTLQNAGILIPPNDMDKMAKTIVELINDDETKMRLSINAERRIKELTWDKVSLPLLEAYESIKYETRHEKEVLK